MSSKHLVVLGIRGVPAQHGGFETFAEYLCRYLVTRDWNVTVYCQEEGTGPIYQSKWEGVQRIHMPVKNTGPLGTMMFDLKSVRHSLRYDGVFLTLGYNTAIFNLLHRLKGKRNVINMDGIEWKRQKWGFLEKTWLYVNEHLGGWLGNHLIADHPEIQKHLGQYVSTKKISLIPYGAPHIEKADKTILTQFDLTPQSYCLVVARPEPENHMLEIVRSFSPKKRNCKLVLIGNYSPQCRYHKKVIKVASNEVFFLGALYDKQIVSTLRYYCRLYIHGHSVGGTNPSLVEAMGAGSPILAHDNVFNRWVACNCAHFFKNEVHCEKLFSYLLNDKEELDVLRKAASERFKQNFTWEKILQAYENLLKRHV